jgi:predicted lactoylglutathione lyase
MIQILSKIRCHIYRELYIVEDQITVLLMSDKAYQHMTNKIKTKDQFSSRK